MAVYEQLVLLLIPPHSISEQFHHLLSKGQHAHDHHSVSSFRQNKAYWRAMIHELEVQKPVQPVMWKSAKVVGDQTDVKLVSRHKGYGLPLMSVGAGVPMYKLFDVSLTSAVLYYNILCKNWKELVRNRISFSPPFKSRTCTKMSCARSRIWDTIRTIAKSVAWSPVLKSGWVCDSHPGRRPRDHVRVLLLRRLGFPSPTLHLISSKSGY